MRSSLSWLCCRRFAELRHRCLDQGIAADTCLQTVGDGQQEQLVCAGFGCGLDQRSDNGIGRSENAALWWDQRRCVEGGFRFGDVDGGSTTNETFTLLAFDASNTLITTPWLDEPVYTGGIGTGPGSSLVIGNMPGWSWNAGTGEYFIDGSTITTANPSVSIYLESNMDISYLQVTRTSGFASFSLGAPLVPAPGSAALFGLAGIAGLRRRR